MMKRVTKKLVLVVLAVAMMSMALVGCGVDMSKMKGDWIVSTINGKSVADFAAENGLVEAQAMKAVTITDETATAKSFDSSSGQVVTVEGKITKRTDGVEADIQGIIWPFKLQDNGNLTYKLDANGTVYEYVLVKGTYDFEAKYAEQTGAQQGGEEQPAEGGEEQPAEGGEEQPAEGGEEGAEE